MRKELDIQANRKSRKYPLNIMRRRVLWTLVQPFFRLSPRPCFGWRRFLLRLFGAKVGRRVHVYNSAMVVMPWNLEIGDWSSVGERALLYNLGMVSIGRQVTISHMAHICAGTHDYTRPDLPLLKPPVTIASQAWICAQAFVGPGITVGEGAVVGAGGVVVKDVPPWTVVAGNPAVVIGPRTLVNGARQAGQR